MASLPLSNSDEHGSSRETHLAPGKAPTGFPTRAAHGVFLVSLIPRHWVVYLVGIFFYGTIFVNLDGNAEGNDSRLYFTLWMMGILLISVMVAVTTVNLMSKSMFFCMPGRQIAMRRMLLCVGLFISLLFMGITVLPKYSFWAPTTTLGLISLVPIGLMLFLAVLAIMIFFPTYSAWFLVPMMFSTNVIERYYFRGSGPDVARPPEQVVVSLGLFSLVVIAFVWRSLGSKNTLRTLSTNTYCRNVGRSSVAAEMENLGMMNRLGGKRVFDFSGTASGSRLLERIRRAGDEGLRKIWWSLVYRIQSANDRWNMLLTWLLATLFGILIAFELVDDPAPEVLFYLLSVLASIQGALLFRRNRSPFLPMGRKAFFIESVFYGLLRYLLIIVVHVTIVASFYWINRMVPEQIWSEHALAVVNLPIKVHLYFLFVTPLLIFMFHVSRAPAWMLLAFVSNMILTYSSPEIARNFASLPFPILIFLLVGSWVPFFILAYLRCFKQDQF